LIIGAASLANPHSSGGLAFGLFAAVFIGLAFPLFRVGGTRPGLAVFGVILVILGTLSLGLAILLPMCSLGKPAP
jgi:hypothetical protein